jgi:L-cysteine/cystine lyase
MVDSWRTLQELGPFGSDAFPWMARETTALRAVLAHWCGVPPHRVALTENVTSGCVLPLWGLPFQAGERLLLSDAEHPGVVAAATELARRQGLAVDCFPVQGARDGAEVLRALEEHLQPSTRLVALSHLLWNTGVPMPIEAVADRLDGHPLRPWLLVDAAQAMGSLVLGSVPDRADIYAFTGHKWCCGPEGLGGVVLSQRLLDTGSPTLIGWRSLADEGQGDSPWHQDARRFEVATSCLPLGAGLRASLAELELCGTEGERDALIRQRSRRLWEGLRDRQGLEPLLQEAPPASGLVSFTAPGLDPQLLVRALARRGLHLRMLTNPPCLRACTHVVTTEEEVDTLLEQLDDLLSTGLTA